MRKVFPSLFIILTILGVALSEQLPTILTSSSVSDSELGEILKPDDRASYFRNQLIYAPILISPHVPLITNNSLDHSVGLFTFSFPIIETYRLYKYSLNILIDSIISPAIEIIYYPKTSTERITAEFSGNFNRDLGLYRDDSGQKIRMPFEIIPIDDGITFVFPVDIDVPELEFYYAVEFQLNINKLSEIGIILPTNDTFTIELKQSVIYISPNQVKAETSLPIFINFSISNTGVHNNGKLVIPQNKEPYKALNQIYFVELNRLKLRVTIGISFISFLSLLILSAIVGVRRLPPVVHEDLNSWEID